jgi:hypothetical protein
VCQSATLHWQEMTELTATDCTVCTWVVEESELVALDSRSMVSVLESEPTPPHFPLHLRLTPMRSTSVQAGGPQCTHNTRPSSRFCEISLALVCILTQFIDACKPRRSRGTTVCAVLYLLYGCWTTWVCGVPYCSTGTVVAVLIPCTCTYSVQTVHICSFDYLNNDP